GDEAMLDLLAAISDADTFDCVMAERAVLAGLGGTCHSPIAAFARLEDGQVRLRAEIISPDGQETVGETARIERGDAAAAEAMGRGLLDRASPALRLLFEA
ncbi:hypothetical protein AI27_10640, partial [Sphingomonas sp. BHC-A]